MKSLKAKAYAKVNLFLDVTGKREDGYHLLDTVMQSLGLYDEIEVTLTGNGKVTVLCDKDELSGEGNIVFAACEQFFKFSGWKSGLNIFINKNIPLAAGTGGGSADAAAVLKILNILSGKNYDSKTLCEIALTLGADVPFCIDGGTARAGGIGERLKALNTPRLYAVLLKEYEKKSTGEMYRRIDIENPVPSGDIEKLIEGINKNSNELIFDNMYNAFSVCWDLNKMTEPFLPYSPDATFLSGSGPTVCALFETEEAAILAAKGLKNNGYNANYAPFVDRGVSVE